jgi:hypothetical protein
MQWEVDTTDVITTTGKTIGTGVGCRGGGGRGRDDEGKEAAIFTETRMGCYRRGADAMSASTMLPAIGGGRPSYR